MIERLKASLPGQMVRLYISANAGLYATVIAYNAAFAMFPILLTILFITAVILRDPSVSLQVEAAILVAFPADIASETITVLQSTRQEAGLVGLISLIGLLWAGSRLFGALEVAFNRIYDVPDRPLIRQKLMATAMIFVFAILLPVALAAMTTAQLLLQYANNLPIATLPGFNLLGPLISLTISVAAAFALFLLIYCVVPNVRLTAGDVWQGAVLATTLFLLLIQVFPLYVHLFANFSRFGAVFGFAFLYLTWFYFVAQTILIGAILNALRKPKPEPRAAG